MPLILHGARQVGKTTLVKAFGETYEQFLYFNLERSVDNQLFNNIEDLKATLNEIFINRNMRYEASIETLIFIDEVQDRPKVIEQLRYFYEDYPHIHVIVTGSLLDFGMRKIQKMPVGRVQFANLYPLTFQEFLDGQGLNIVVNALTQIPFNNDLLNTYLNHFREYAMIGGMPRIVSAYFESDKNLSAVYKLYDDIIEAYRNDVEKYASNRTQQEVIRHVMNTLAYEVDNRIKFSKFGGSEYGNRAVKEALFALESAKIIDVIYPTTMTSPPMSPSIKKRPRLGYMDIGLLCYQLNIQNELLKNTDLNSASRGKIAQQVVIQEIKASFNRSNQIVRFWVRETKGTSSEVDIIHQYEGMLIPIEVKSGSKGTLRSLHEYMDRCPHKYAIRMYAGELRIDDMVTRKEKKYKLLNMPYFLASQIDTYLAWFIQQVK